MKDEFLTIEKHSEFEYKELGSKFLGLIFPIAQISEIDIIIHEITKKYYDASHHCYAYRIGLDGNSFRYSDAGEPTGTAGKPILGAIDNHKLTNVLIIVTRYFGGKKLGVSGLTKAYFFCADEVIKKSNIINKIITKYINLDFEHNLTNLIMRTISQFGANTTDQVYDENVHFKVQIRLSREEEFKKYLVEKTNGRIIIGN